MKQRETNEPDIAINKLDLTNFNFVKPLNDISHFRRIKLISYAPQKHLRSPRTFLAEK